MTDHLSPEHRQDEHEDQWAMRVQDISQHFDYPPTPNIAGSVRAHLEQRAARPGWYNTLRRPRLADHPAHAAASVLLIALVLILVTVLAVPDLRARAFDWLRIGAVRITDESPPAAPDSPPDLTLDDPLFDPQFAVTLDDARAQVDFPVTIPAEFGAPDHVFLHQLRDPVVILVWTNASTLPPSITPPLSLHLIGAANVVHKYTADVEIYTQVGDQEAVWLTNPHTYILRPGDPDMVQRFVTGGVLIWESADPMHPITYRLEGDLTLDDARRIAESLP